MSTSTTAALFCTACNATREFSVSLDTNGDFLATCPECAAAIKFAGSGDLVAMVASHNASNGPVLHVDEDGNIIPTEEQQAQLDALAAANFTPDEPGE